jgi:hypothetical protein
VNRAAWQLMGYSISHIRVRSRKIGIVDLEKAFAEVRDSGQADHDEITVRLLELIGKRNYVPSSARAEYGEALLSAYRRFIGEDVPDDQGVLEIRVYGGD